jgi:hypothetical protein
MSLKNSRLLKLSANPLVGDLGLSQAQQIDCLTKKGSAMIGLGFARNNIHHRCLTGTIRADHTTKLSAINRERELIEGTKSIKTHRNIF